MGWPGIGPLLLEAILTRDVYVVISAVMLSSVLVILANLVADFLRLFIRLEIDLHFQEQVRAAHPVFVSRLLY